MAGISHFLIFVTQTRATVKGETIKHVECERCAFKYAYRLRRTAEGKATSFIIPDKNAAVNKAEEQLKRMLEGDCDPVPCPTCGWYQRSMVRRVKHQSYRGMVRIGQILLVLSVIVGIMGGLVALLGRDFVDPRWPSASVLYGLAGVALALGICLPVTKVLLAWLHDPNGQDEDIRKQLGQTLACGKGASGAGDTRA
jgi:hypothetical protein